MLLEDFFKSIDWQPRIGDPSLTGWTIVAAYVVCLLLCAWCWRRRDRLIDRGRARRFGGYWLTLAVVMLMLAINKQLDLQSLIHTTGRNLAIEQGWFDKRRAVQRAFIYAVGGVGVLSVLGLFVLMRGVWGRVWLSSVGVVVLVGFIVLRAASFHDMDDLLKREVVGGVRMNFVMELAGIVLVALSAGVNLLWLKTGVKPASRGPA